MENKQVPFIIDEEGFIEPSKIHSNAKINVAFIGDSTIECAIVDPEKRYPYLVGRILEKRLDVSVNSYNAGFSGGASLEYLTELIYKILPLHPRMVVWCSNIHELEALLQYSNWLDYIKSEKNIFYLENDLHQGKAGRIKEAFRTLFPNIYTQLYVLKHHRENDSQFSLEPFSDYREITENDWNYIKEQILGNLKVFTDICKNNNIMPIVMTQAGMFKDSNNVRTKKIYEYLGMDRQTRLGYSDFAHLFLAVNEAIREFCFVHSIQLIDLEKKIPADNKYIYDNVHYTNDGSVMVADYIAKKIMLLFQEESF